MPARTISTPRIRTALQRHQMAGRLGPLGGEPFVPVDRPSWSSCWTAVAIAARKTSEKPNRPERSSLGPSSANRTGSAAGAGASAGAGGARAVADAVAQRMGVGERDHVELALVLGRAAGLDPDPGGAEQAGEQARSMAMSWTRSNGMTRRWRWISPFSITISPGPIV